MGVGERKAYELINEQFNDAGCLSSLQLYKDWLMTGRNADDPWTGGHIIDIASAIVANSKSNDAFDMEAVRRETIERGIAALPSNPINLREDEETIEKITKITDAIIEAMQEKAKGKPQERGGRE